MKKTKSTSHIKTESPFSSKKSSEAQKQVGRWPRLASSKSIATLPAPHTLSYGQLIMNHQQETNNGLNYFENRTMSKSTIVRKQMNSSIRDRISSLHRNIERLQNQISQSKKYNKKCKQYDEELGSYAQITSNIENLQLKLKIEMEKMQQVDNCMMMLKQEYISAKMNFEEALAEREYCDDVLERYQTEYQNEGTLVIQLFDKQRQNQNDIKEIKRLNIQIRQKQRNLQQWRNEIGYNLQEKVSKNKLTQLRIDLMKAQQFVNVYAQKNNMMKLRQILCLHVKLCQEQNRVSASCFEINQESMQFFVCKNGMIDEFERAVIDYRGKERQKYELKIIEKYFQIFKKIQLAINNPKLRLQQNINSQLTSEVCVLRKLLIKTEAKLQVNEQELKQLRQKLQVAFANESVAMIQHLRESSGKYELGQIKKKLKELKQEQNVRINQIRQVYKVYDKLEAPQIKLTDVDYMNNMGQFSKVKNVYEGQVHRVKCQLTLQKRKKEQVEIVISEAVGKWGEISGKKQELKGMYRQLNKLNKQLGLSQRLNCVEKLNETKAKQNLIKKSQVFSHSMRETIRLKIQGRNKQNENKIMNKFTKENNVRFNSNSKFFKEPKCMIEEVCRTRKQSLSGFSSMNGIGINSKINERGNLTTLLASKFNR